MQFAVRRTRRQTGIEILVSFFLSACIALIRQLQVTVWDHPQRTVLMGCIFVAAEAGAGWQAASTREVRGQARSGWVQA